MREGVEITDGRTVLDPADLRLGESEPGAEQFLGNAVTPVAGREFAVPAVGAGNAADVLGGERVPECWSVQKAGVTAGGSARSSTVWRSQEPHSAPAWFQARRFPQRQYLGALVLIWSFLPASGKGYSSCLAILAAYICGASWLIYATCICVMPVSS